jgi:PEP-CTERM motif
LNLKNILAIAALSAAALPAFAADQVVDLSSGQGSFIGTGPLLAGGDDVVSFVNLAAGTYDFVLSFSGQNISKFAGSLNGKPVDMMTSGRITFGGLEGMDTAPFTLTLVGTALSKAGYSGELSVTAVPEPSTYAMLVAGLCAIGFSVSRRRRQG